MGEFSMSKVTSMEEMYLIYQAMRSYLAGGGGECPLTELLASYRSFCAREPIGGMFLEYVFEELMDRVEEGRSM